MRRVAWVVALCALMARCASAPPPALTPTAPQFPDFVYPEPPAGTPSTTAERLARGWRLLQANNITGAEREFTALLATSREFAPAATAVGYVELARERPRDALARFEAALPGGRAYPPALVGRGLALLASGNADGALGSFEAALAADASLTDLPGRVATLRVRVLQDRIGRAERAAAAGQFDEGRTAYRSAIDAAPDSAFLHRDLAFLERRAGRADAALAAARSALALDADDARTHVLVGELLAARDDLDGALAAYRRAAELEPSSGIDAAIARLTERLRDAALPVQYRTIGERPQATRGDLAALLGVRLGPVLTNAPQRQMIVTDVRDHWASPWILVAARAGAMEVFPNYTFQPAAPLRRGDLADAVSRVLGLLAQGNGAAAARWEGAAVTVSDVPSAHLAYPAVRRAVAAGVLPLREGAFRPLEPVTGAELTDAVSRLASMTGGRK